MIETQEPTVAPVTRRRRWILPLVVVAVALAGIGVGIALANQDDTSGSTASASGQLADISQACATWMNDAGSGPTSAGWCQDMTGWMSRHMGSGSMMGPMMWGDPEQMLSACRTWMNDNPSTERPAEWCENMMRGIRPQMNGDWDQWDDWMNGPMMGG
ncbi:MAG: hypothetical protein CL424_15100 [Acidimicrobiaceae bacterium]|nr:hypothetical protein [Acidimicrobiaceae bacterium]